MKKMFEGIAMTRSQANAPSGVIQRLIQLVVVSLGLVFQTSAYAFTLNVVGSDGAPMTGFRWLMEEDQTWPVTPGVVGADNIKSRNFYRSYMPVAAKGQAAATSASITPTNPASRYFVSVLPNAGYGTGGASIPANLPADAIITVTVHPIPLPTAQIRVLAVHDNNPINNNADFGQEEGLGGFTILIDDTVDVVKDDALGNPLGTVYTPGTTTVACVGTGVVTTLSLADYNAKLADPVGNYCRNPYDLRVGEALIKNLHPHKYGVRAVPPDASGWQQTGTIEGTKTIDAWVLSNEPAYFSEGGGPGLASYHSIFPFIKPFNTIPAPTAGVGTISGTIVNLHSSRPPNFTFYPGHALPNCWIGLNLMTGGNIGGVGAGIYAAPCNADSTFSIPNVPSGTYQLAVWDQYLDNIFALQTVIVPAAGGNVVVGDANGNFAQYDWFGAVEHYVFYDTNQNGFRDPGEPGIPEQAVNLRFRDGTIYQAFPTDLDGYVPFDEVFPWFNWLVAEVDFLRYKATGLTSYVDAGGPVDTANTAAPGWGKLTPQPQIVTDAAQAAALGLPVGAPINNPNTGDNLSRTETGPVLTQAFQSFLSTVNVFEWGKAAYAPGENGGVSGIVRYATTRAEDDPRYATPEDWEPGIPRVQVNLYQNNGSGGIVDANANGTVDLADVDNFPFGWSEGGVMGQEDQKRNGPLAGTFDPALVFNAGDAVQIATTDSWEDNLPANCPGDMTDPFFQDGKCYDGQRNFNQTRPGLFDGGYAFTSMIPGGASSGGLEVTPLPAAPYVVEAVPPPHYVTVKEEDKNVDFGEEYIPSPLLLPPVCVGDLHVVPAELSLFPGVPGAYAGQSRALCDRKAVTLTSGANAAADFALFTEVPVAGHITGVVLNDLANSTNPNTPAFGEKYAPAWLPMAVRDWQGKEITRFYGDEFGGYNALVPANFSNSRPSPGGFAYAMYQVCANDPGPIPDPANPGHMITDPNFNTKYAPFCAPFMFQPGRTTFLDTPILPTVAFAAAEGFPLDCEFSNSEPKVYSVSDSANGYGGGPYVSATGGTITITAVGNKSVPNPAWDGTNATPSTITRDYGFGGTQGAVTLAGVPLSITSWSPTAITAQVPAGATSGQILVTRGDNNVTSTVGVTVTVGGTGNVIPVSSGGSIQAAIDAANSGDLILVAPGVYNELVVMWKPVLLQGWGAESTVISALRTTNKLEAWRQKVKDLVLGANGVNGPEDAVTLLPGQVAAPTTDPTVVLGIPGLFSTEQGPGIMVLAKDGAFTGGRIDGFTVTSAVASGGIIVNGYANAIEISNNRVAVNQGPYGAGIRLGQPLPASSFNPGANIHNNHVTQNGALDAPGGGIALYSGSDNYAVSSNFVCGNFARNDGAGIAHFGFSPNGMIKGNTIAFNQTFVQGLAQGGAGGGILVAGPTAAAGALSQGTGTVTIDGNLIQGNQASTGDGGGIAARSVNGQDVAISPADSTNWNRLNVFNNIIVNNNTGLAGGGIALQDVLRANIVNNTIAHNDSTGTAGAAFIPGNPNESTSQPAGVVSRQHSLALLTALGAGATPDFSSPLLDNNIIWHNRSFHWMVGANVASGTLVPDITTPDYRDLLC
jgi:hypothetical protein